MSRRVKGLTMHLDVRVALGLILLLPTADSSIVTACDWDLPPQSRDISVPLQPWHSAPPGKTLIGISYTVAKNGTLTFTRTVESQYGQLGVTHAKLDEEDAATLGLEPAYGLRITQVVVNSAAEAHGLMEGDVVLKADREFIADVLDFPTFVRNHDLDQPLILEIYRDGSRQIKSITLDRKMKQEVLFQDLSLPLTLEHLHSGGTFGELTAQARRFLYGDETGGTGAIVVDIRGGTPLFYSEVRRGDIISAIDGKPVTHPSVIAERFSLAAGSGKSVVLTLQRGHLHFQDRLSPVRDLSRGFTIDIPVVIRWRISPSRTDFDLGWGLVMDYDRRARVTSTGQHRETKELGLVLGLIKFETSARRRGLSLLWLFDISW